MKGWIIMNINKDKLVEATIKMLTEENLKYGMYSGLTKGDIDVLTSAEQIKDIPLSDKINLIYYCKDGIAKNKHLYIPARILNNVPEKQQDELRIYKPYNYIHSLSQLVEYPELLSILYSDETIRNTIKDYAMTSEEPVYAINKNTNTRGNKSVPSENESDYIKTDDTVEKTNFTSDVTQDDKSTISSEPEEQSKQTRTYSASNDLSNTTFGDPTTVFNFIWKKMPSSAKRNLANIAKDSLDAEEFRQKVISKGNAGIFQMQGGDELAAKLYDALKDYE